MLRASLTRSGLGCEWYVTVVCDTTRDAMRCAWNVFCNANVCLLSVRFGPRNALILLFVLHSDPST